VAFFQVPWAKKHGAVETFGCEAAIVAGLFILLIPALQWQGRYLRVRFQDFGVACTLTNAPSHLGPVFDALMT